MGSNGKANKAADHGKDPIIIIENKMTKVDPTFHDDQEVTKGKMVPSECESTDESCYLKCGKILHSKPAQVRLIYQNVKYLHFIFTIETATIFTIFLIEIGLYQFRIRSPQNVDVSSVLDFQIFCCRPETTDLYPRS